MASQRNKKTTIKVVFDTNAIYNGHADYLLSLEVSKLIELNSNHTDIAIEWCLPEIVKLERQYQMSGKAVEFLNCNGKHND